MSEKKVKSTVPKSAAGASTSRTAASNAIRSRHRMTRNYLAIWVDPNIDENNEDCRNALEQLHTVVTEVCICTTPAQCIQFLNEINDEKAFVISSGALGQSLVNDIHSMSKLDAIYIFCRNKARHESWSKEWSKIRGVFTSIKPICESLRKVAHECDHDSIPMSFVPKQTVKEGATGSDRNNLDRLPPSYMYSIMFKEIILEINDDDEKSVNTLVKFCQKQNISETQISEFKRECHDRSPVYWYTKPMFLYGMLNRGLRSLDMEAMSKLGFFIQKLHLQLKQLHQEQSASFQTAFTVYRSQGLSQPDFQNLFDSKDDSDPQISTLTNRIKDEISGRGWYRTGKLMLNVGHFDQAQELYNELLENASNDSDRAFIYHQLGVTNYHQGKYQEAASFYEKSLEIKRETLPEDDASLAPIYSNIGAVYRNMGDYSKALEYYEKSLRIKEISLPPTHPDLASSYSCIGLMYNTIDDHSKALQYYEKSLRIRENALPPTHQDFAISYNNIGGVHNDTGEYSKALEYYEKANKIWEISLPPTYPYLTTSYNNIGGVYNTMGDYSKALEYYEKSLRIREKALPPTYPNLAGSYLNFAGCCEKMGNYTAALKALQNAYKIQEKTFQENNPAFVLTFN
ncbi:unnamed protein product [Rotaria magnacalcarata]|uniref:Uncharacterized protein n=1 Tax=Rotaria magnacalcarata TaxID=392030 RepID=A0A819SJ70_9BILA|nr:unnamed protein product [Rotaria magnacalcarata]